MCLIAFALQPGTALPLVVASNRDEYWDRPTEPLAQWHTRSGHTVWAGRDVRAGGSWLGFSPQGRVAMLTNVRSTQPDTAPRSRGLLVTDWLTSHLPALQWLERHTPQDYGPFNLVLGDLASQAWFWGTNTAPTVLQATSAGQTSGNDGLPAGWYGSALGPGVYGLSNAHLDTPWPKTVRLRQAVQGWLQDSGQNRLPEGEHQPLPDNPSTPTDRLLHALSSLTLAPTSALPQTGLPLELEHRLSSAFVHDPARRYGTRSTLLARLDAAHPPAGIRPTLHLQEWTHDVERPLPPGSTHWPLQQVAYSTVRRFFIPM